LNYTRPQRVLYMFHWGISSDKSTFSSLPIVWDKWAKMVIVIG